jgi:uncharacterized protein
MAATLVHWLYTSGMKQRVFLPRKMDVGAFIESGEPLSGHTPVAELSRLCASLIEGVPPEQVSPVTWQAQGETVPQRVGAPQTWLRIQAQATLPYECQRCLHPVMLDVVVDQRIRFVADETTAASLDAESDDDVLALSRQFNLLELIEDELIMAEPMLPRHDECPVDLEPWMGGADEPETSPEEAATGVSVALAGTGKPHPFAALAALKKKPDPSSEGDES